MVLDHMCDIWYHICTPSTVLFFGASRTRMAGSPSLHTATQDIPTTNPNDPHEGQGRIPIGSFCHASSLSVSSNTAVLTEEHHTTQGTAETTTTTITAFALPVSFPPLANVKRLRLSVKASTTEREGRRVYTTRETTCA